MSYGYDVECMRYGGLKSDTCILQNAISGISQMQRIEIEQWAL